MKSLSQQFNSMTNSSNPSNADTTKNMEPLQYNPDATVVKAELIVNITLGASNILTDSTIATIQDKYKSAIINTRSCGMIRYNSRNESVYADFIPLPEKSLDKYGNYNCAVWRLTFADGTTKVLTHSQSIKYWNTILTCDADTSATDLDFFVKVNFPVSYGRQAVNSIIRSGDARSYVITFNDVDHMFNYAEDAYRGNLRLTPVNASVDFADHIIEVDRPTLGGRLKASDFTDEAKVTAINLSSFKKSTSSKRRDARRAASQAAKEANTPKFTFDSAPAKEEATQEAVVETPNLTATVEAAKAGVRPVAEVPSMDFGSEPAPKAEEVPAEVTEEEPTPVAEPQPEEEAPSGFNKKGALRAKLAARKAKKVEASSIPSAITDDEWS
jgi:hypothetical protein